MSASAQSLRQDAVRIWNAGVQAVRSEQLIEQNVSWTSKGLKIAEVECTLAAGARIEVIGAGKAGAGMAAGLLQALQKSPERLTQHPIDGWINVPADCVRPLDGIHLHAARPAGLNEPTEAGVAGTAEILKRIERRSSNDLCIALISGGGSALLPAPAPPVTLSDKQQITRFLAAQGATIQELNTVRSQLSLVKGGNLARRCNAGTLVTLIISDVIGDPLEYIASGPTVLSDPDPRAATQILLRYDPDRQHIPPSAFELLEARTQQRAAQSTAPSATIVNRIVGSNRIALQAAAEEARAAGFEVIDLGSENSGDAAEHGRALASRLQRLRNEVTAPTCVLAGGETTVQLVAHTTDDSGPGKGGRNQEVVLAAIDCLPASTDWSGICLLSGGTDGEDGPTDATGALADAELVAAAADQQLNSSEFLQRHDSWHYFAPIDGLLRTGPTHTNVMDLAVGLVWPE